MAWELASQSSFGQTRGISEIKQLGMVHPGSYQSVFLPLTWLSPPPCVTVGQEYVCVSVWVWVWVWGVIGNHVSSSVVPISYYLAQDRSYGNSLL